MKPDREFTSRVKMAAKRIHIAGGCDAKNEYSKGYDAITLALDILLEETGYVIEDIIDYGEIGQDI